MKDFGLSRLKHKDFEDSINNIVNEYVKLEEENKRLREENSQLKAENYKDAELKSLSDKLTVACAMANHYGLLDSDYKDLMKWWNDHIYEKHSKDIDIGKKVKFCKDSPTYKFEITETAVGTCYTIKCCKCGESDRLFY